LGSRKAAPTIGKCFPELRSNTSTATGKSRILTAVNEMSKKIPFKLVMSAVLIALLLPVQARADTVFTRADAEQLHSLVSKLFQKLVAAHHDIADAFNQTAHNNSANICLAGLADDAVPVEMVLGSTLTLLTLAAEMRDKMDEHYVLEELRDTVILVTQQLTNYRQLINQEMSQCSESATVNMKGQAVINIFSEIQQALAPVSNKLQNLPTF
jgi:hypothetical protein